MSAPTASVRALMLERDLYRCLSCGALVTLQANHRRAVGMGGSSVRPEIGDLVTACSSCNARFESDLDVRALCFGWKVRRWVRDPLVVPVLCAWSGQWWRLTFDGGRQVITAVAALSMMREVYGSEWDGWRSAA